MLSQYTFCCFDLIFQLLVGSEDFDIRVFKEDEIIAEMTETEVSMPEHQLPDFHFVMPNHISRPA